MESLNLSLLFILFASIFLFGCTSSGGADDSELDSALSAARYDDTKLDSALSAARYDDTKLVVMLTMGDDDVLLPGKITFISDSGKKQYIASEGYVLLNRADVCGGSRGEIELFDDILVTFDDSPAQETWTWDDREYCDSYKYHMSITEEQYREIKNPENIALTKGMSIVALDRTKKMFYMITSDDSELANGTALFISPEGNLSVRFDNYAIVDIDDFCVNGEERYQELYFSFDRSPVGERRYWSDFDYCDYDTYSFSIDIDDYNSMADPRYDISLFEFENEGGNPIDAIVYCNDVPLGKLVNGHLNASKLDIMDAMISDVCDLHFVGNFTVFNKPYRFDFCGWEITASDLATYSSAPEYLNSTFENYYRTAPCTTPMSFITPDDTTVKYRLQRYLSLKTSNVYNDLDLIRSHMEKDFGYEFDKDQFPTDSWWQLPTEFMSSKMANKGDCEDWASSFLSLVYAREQPTRCWAMLVAFLYANESAESAHVSVFCDVNGVHKIYDQTGTVTEPDIWQEYFDWFDSDGEYSAKGVVEIRPFGVFNNTFYADVESVEEMYEVLGINN